MLKALLLSRYLRCLLIMKENGLIRNLRLISKFMTSQVRQKIITIHTLPNISRSESNWAMKLGQLLEYNVRNLFT